jgi:hypothetical protein
MNLVVNGGGGTFGFENSTLERGVRVDVVLERDGGGEEVEDGGCLGSWDSGFI